MVQLLDYAKELGILASVKDEGDFWERRDIEALIKEVGEWNQMIAGFYGQMKDSLAAAGNNPMALMSEIARFPDFEHLEVENERNRKG